MTSFQIARTVPIVRTPRVMQLEGMFDLPRASASTVAWSGRIPLDEHPWSIGLIAGPSGSGKSSVARELFGPAAFADFDWPHDKSIVDGFPDELSIREVTSLLSSVGFSSPPAWLRPFHVLSAGEQFRANLARALAAAGGTVVVDEFTSVVDRTVARVGSAAVAKAIRRKGGTSFRFVAVSCHDDIIEWLDPDWTFVPATGAFQWRLERRRRPPIELEITRIHRSAWKLFKPHHYLSAELHPSAKCFAAFFEGRPAAFTAAMAFPHPHRSGWREHRTVCLPDYQGVGIGNAISEFVASLFAALGKAYSSVTSHPAMIRHRLRSPVWRLMRKPRVGKRQGLPGWKGSGRMTAGFRYVGPASDCETATRLICMSMRRNRARASP